MHHALNELSVNGLSCAFLFPFCFHLMTHPLLFVTVRGPVQSDFTFSLTFPQLPLFPHYMSSFPHHSLSGPLLSLKKKNVFPLSTLLHHIVTLFFPPLLPPPPPSIIRNPPACPGRIPGAWFGPPPGRLVGQAAAPGASVWVVQQSQLAASCQRPGIHRLRHQLHRAGQPRGLLGWLPERRSAGGPEGSLHHRLPEDGSRRGGRPPADQRGPGRLRGGPVAAEGPEDVDI